MMAEKYNLRWHTYTDHLQKMLQEIKEEFTDVTLICDDKKKIRAHRNILAGCSPVFKSIFQSEDVQNPIIFLRGIKQADMESILQFIYFGEASLYQERMDEFLQAAKSLEIAELSTVHPFIQSPNSNTDDYDRPTGEATTAENEIEEKLEEVLETYEGKIIKIRKKLGRSKGSSQCQECEKTFSRSQILKRHVEAIHGGIKHKCQQCPKEYTSLDNLKSHVKITHEGQKFLCNHCSVTFVQKRRLDAHIRKHNSSTTLH